MALFCLADSLDDLRERLGNIIVGTNSKKEYIYEEINDLIKNKYKYIKQMIIHKV